MATSMFHGKLTALEVVQGLNVKLDGKIVLITGTTSAMNSESIKNFERFLSLYEDIGTETARALASANAHVIITARDMNKGTQVVEHIKKSTGNDKVKVMEMDLTSLQSVQNFVSQFRVRKFPVNILICM
jgi:NAD(P)-dependent dehydrogenase (short-subunit alcohol dehydrogenase family)